MERDIFTAIVKGTKDQLNYVDAKVIKVHGDNYDLEFFDGTIRKLVQNSSSEKFNGGDHVAVLFSRLSKDEIRIIGRGRIFKRSIDSQTVMV